MCSYYKNIKFRKAITINVMEAYAFKRKKHNSHVHVIRADIGFTIRVFYTAVLSEGDSENNGESDSGNDVLISVLFEHSVRFPPKRGQISMKTFDFNFQRMPLGLHRNLLAYFVQAKGLTGMGQEFTFAHVEWLIVMEVRILSVTCHFVARFELLTLKCSTYYDSVWILFLED